MKKSRKRLREATETETGIETTGDACARATAAVTDVVCCDALIHILSLLLYLLSLPFLLVPTLTHSYSHLLSLYLPRTYWDRESRENEDVLALDSLNAGPVGGSQVRRGTLRQTDRQTCIVRERKGGNKGGWREGRFFHQSMQVHCTVVLLPTVRCITDSTEHTYDSLSNNSHTPTLNHSHRRRQTWCSGTGSGWRDRP
jgi:hypothetical protein